MTRINKMVMHGFKSFAKHTELMFGGDFNVILGPNGSGKSNVLDALCFVLGKGSAKAMRAEKSSNLIYNGGKTRKQAKQGEVSIYFDNSNKKFPTDEKEIKITRVVRQNGQSIYKINDKLRTRQQILDLLNIAKIDPDGHNIILQGDIVRFVEMPPLERRLLIEEISGISVYEEKKHKAELELEKVEKNLNDVGIILTERNTYLKELKKDRDQALKFKDMNTMVKESKASLLKMRIDQNEKEKKELEGKIDSTKEELDKINSAITQLKNGNNNKKQRIESISNEIEEKGEVEQVNLNMEVESLKIDLTKKSSRIEQLKNEVSKLTQRKKDLREAIKETNQKISQSNEEKSTLQKQKSGLLEDKEKISKRIFEFKQKNQLDNIVDIEKSIDNIDKNAEELQQKINSLREKQHDLIRKKDMVQHNINTIDETINKVTEVEKEHKKEIADLKNKREEFKKSALDLNKRLDEDISLATQISNSRNKLANASGELEKLKVRELGIKEMRSGDIAIKKILEQKNKLRGIYGTVGELGDVSAKYSLALEVAAGPRIKSIIVEDENVASEAIKYIKENKLGIATFMPLNKIKPKEIKPELKKLAEAKGSYGLAIDLVSFDKKFEKVFSHLFSNTLVVDNIDVARRLGIGKARMVSLDGDIAEYSGVMVGGYRKRKGLGFKEKEITKDIEEYEEVVSNLEKALTTLEKRREENEKTITDLRQKKAYLEADIIRIEKTLHLEPADLEVSKQKKEDLNQNMKEIEREIAEVEEEISKLNRELTKNKIEKQDLRSKISELRDPALIAELSTFEQKSREIN